MKSDRTPCTQRPVISVLDIMASSPPEGDEWAEIGASELSGEVTIRAVAKGGEPHFISVSVGSDRGNVRVGRISCCEYLEELAERILGTERMQLKKAEACGGRKNGR